MREITSHKVNGCNEAILIEAGDKQTSGGAPSAYWITLPPEMKPTIGGPDAMRATSFTVQFQDGPIKEVGTNGVTHESLLAILIDRLQSFQRGEYSCRENAIALTHLEDAMHWLSHRNRSRVDRGIEGPSAK